MNETTTRKGIKTSEFLGLVLFVVVLLLNGTPYVNIPNEHVMTLAGMIFGYGGGRVLLKNQLAKKEGAS